MGHLGQASGSSFSVELEHGVCAWLQVQGCGTRQYTNVLDDDTDLWNEDTNLLLAASCQVRALLLDTITHMLQRISTRAIRFLPSPSPARS